MNHNIAAGGEALPRRGIRHGSKTRDSRGRKRPARVSLEQAMGLLFFLCGTAAVAALLAICVYLILSGLPAIRQVGLVEFLTGPVWAPAQGRLGILPFLLTSAAGTGGAVLLGVPVGLLTAVFLTKMAPAGVAAAIRTAVELLAGIPSIVYGLVGMIVLVPAIQKLFDLPSGASLLAAILVLAVMILPSVVNVAATALEAVPREYEEASLALGATEMETWFRVSLPAARSGVATAIVLGVGRAIGEAMAIIMVSGNVPNLPESLFTPVRFLTTAIASEMSYAAEGSLQRMALYSIGLILFLFILCINAALNFFVKRERRG